MEDISIKNLLYFIVVIIWLIYSFFKKNSKPGKHSRQPAPLENYPEAKPLVSYEEETKEEDYSKEAYSAEAITDEIEELKKTQLLRSASRITKPDKISAYSLTADQEVSSLQDDDISGASAAFEGMDIRKLVIFSEVINRPKY